MLRVKDYPREIQVGDSIWAIKFVRNLGQTATTITWGLCDPSTQTISIRLGQTAKERLKTVLHELLHAIEDEYGIEIPHGLIHKLEDPFARFLIDNYFPARSCVK